jgi:hypothetical protein
VSPAPGCVVIAQTTVEGSTGITQASLPTAPIGIGGRPALGLAPAPGAPHLVSERRLPSPLQYHCQVA